MNANKLAITLRACGIPVTEIAEPCQEADGLVQITKGVHVQVPLEGIDPNVVRECADETFAFCNPRRNLNDLLADIRTAVQAERDESVARTTH